MGDNTEKSWLSGNFRPLCCSQLLQLSSTFDHGRWGTEKLVWVLPKSDLALFLSPVPMDTHSCLSVWGPMAMEGTQERSVRQATWLITEVSGLQPQDDSRVPRAT